MALTRGIRFAAAAFSRMGVEKTVLPEHNLDVLRALAVILVLCAHLMIASPLGPGADRNIGRAGVLLFFVHTSLVLMSSLERGGGTGSHWVSKFYLRRALRIYPLAIAAILLVLFFRISLPLRDVLSPYVVPSAFTIATNIALAQNIANTRDVLGVLWSLPLEVRMYLFLPFCFLIARKSARLVLIALISAIALALLWRTNPVPGLWRFTVVFYVPCFLSGVLAFSLLRTRVWKASSYLWPAMLLALVALWLGSPSKFWRDWEFTIAVGLFIPAFLDLRTSWFTRAAHTLCTYSYGVYLLHIPAIWFAVRVAGKRPVVVQGIVFIVVLVPLVYAAYQFIERPCIQFGKRVVGLAPGAQFVPIGAP